MKTRFSKKFEYLPNESGCCGGSIGAAICSGARKGLFLLFVVLAAVHEPFAVYAQDFPLKEKPDFASNDASLLYAKNFFDLIEKHTKDVKTKKILKGTANILSSTREIDYKSEFAIGESLALEGFKRYGLPVDDPKLQEYINLVGSAVADNSSRSSIPYYFVAIKSELYNAFACPGGIIFVSSALIRSMQDESELACVLAHEVGHVTSKHALKTIKRGEFFEGVSTISAATMKGEEGKSFQKMIGGLKNVLFEKGLDKNMEYEADIAAMEIAYRTGYDPSGMIRVLQMLKEKEQTATKKGTWFSTHPPLTERINKCTRAMDKYPDAKDLAKVKYRFTYHKKRF